MRYLNLCLTFFFCGYAAVLAQDRITGRNFATRSEVIAQNGMVCTAQPLCSQVGIDILKRGGTAVDAAIAVNACLGLMEPTGCGIGGDVFAIVWDARSQKLYGLNGSGRSPARLTLEYFKEKNLVQIPAYGALPVSVPGCVDGWFELHKRFGKMKMADLLAPAIEYAERGFPMPELIAYYLERNVRALEKYPNVLSTYAPNGTTPAKGDIFRNPALAATYRKIATGGRDAFYRGEIAKTMADFIQSQGGFLSVEDLAAHQSEWVEPVSTNYRGYDVWELPPNGQGIAALQMLNILEAFDVKKMGYGSAEYIHHFVEAKKIVYEDRARYYADPAFAKIPVRELISKEYAATRRALLNTQRVGSYVPGKPNPSETTYFTIADKDGNIISIIQSNFRGMGSGMVPPALGFMLQDRGELFSLKEGEANTYAPRKRPFQTIIPAFVTKDGKPFLSFGVMGGDFQPLGHVQIINNIIDFGMNVQEAGDAPRIDHNGGNAEPTGTAPTRGEISLETGVEYEVIRELMRRGHKVGFANGSYGGYQAIMYDAVRKVYYGASESRKDGCAIGY